MSNADDGWYYVPEELRVFASYEEFLIEKGWLGYLIQDPRIEHKGEHYEKFPYIDYPGCGEAKTPEEMMSLAFLDGKTIFERFDELRFFEE